MNSMAFCRGELCLGSLRQNAQSCGPSRQVQFSSLSLWCDRVSYQVHTSKTVQKTVGEGVCTFVHWYVWAHAHAHTVCGGPRLMSDVFLGYSPHYPFTHPQLDAWACQPRHLALRNPYLCLPSAKIPLLELPMHPTSTCVLGS